MKKIKANKESHVINSKYNTGDFYGTGIKQKVGRMREDMMLVGPPLKFGKTTGKAPKSLA
jgi:hypothetical protein